MARRTKILIVSASPILATGMGEVIRLIFGTLLDQYPDQYELHQVALFHSIPVAEPRWPVCPTRSILDEKGATLFAVDDVDGQITFRREVARVRPDIVFAFNDPQRVLHLCDLPQNRGHKLILYINFDGFPYPPDQGPILNRADRIFTMSKFSSRVVLSCLPAVERLKVDHMYCPADVGRFRPLPDSEKQRLRAEALPAWVPKDAFIIGWVGRNQWRKQVWVPYRIIGHLRRGGYLLCKNCGRVTIPSAFLAGTGRVKPTENRDRASELPQPVPCPRCHSMHLDIVQPMNDAFLWIHMPDEPMLQDWDRPVLELLSNTRPGSDIHYTDGFRVGDFKAPNEMPSLYQLFDCLLYPSGGEGFGLPPWEAMCSGIPIVYTNYSSHAEYISEAVAGLPIGGTLQPEGTSCIWRMIADIPQGIEALRRLYEDRRLSKRLGTNGRAFVEHYAPAQQVSRWHEAFQACLRAPKSNHQISD